jgi:signal transduction histidine kinase
MIHVLQAQLRFLEESIQVDVTRPRWEKRGEEKALRLERARLQALSLMSSGLGHELRQPLQTIRMEAENIRDRLMQLGIEDEEIKAAQANIDHDIERIDRNIKLIASISSGNLEKAEDVDLSTVLREHAALFSPRCSTQGIDLRTHIPVTQRAVFSEALISIVFINLVKNSIDAFGLIEDDRSRYIDISLKKVGRFHVVEVADNATGISQEIQPKIFKRFSTPQKTGGWGIGLSNCKVFLESHGGKISFETEEGVGTTFKVELPDQ